MPSVGIAMQNGQNNQVADESENAGYKHVNRFFNFVLFDQSMSSFYKEFNCHDVNEDNVKESA